MQLDPDRSALLIVDVQGDFLPGGALAVEDGTEVIGPIRRLVEADPFALYVATQDWHPDGHVSFASSHEGRQPFESIELHGHEQVLWPDHCTQGTDGAALHPELPMNRVEAIIRKGTNPESDSYSGFRNNWNPKGERPPTGLTGYLRERGIEAVFCCGLARDVCVKWTAEDAVREGFRSYFVWDLTRGVDAGKDDRVRADLQELGVEIVESAQIIES